MLGPGLSDSDLDSSLLSRPQRRLTYIEWSRAGSEDEGGDEDEECDEDDEFDEVDQLEAGSDSCSVAVVCSSCAGVQV